MNASPADRSRRSIVVELALRGVAVTAAIVLILWLLPLLASAAG